MRFQELTINDRQRLNAYLKSDEPFSCAKAPTTKIMWKGFHASFYETDDYVIIKNETEFFGTAFDFPLLKTETADVNKALEELETYCSKTGQNLVFFALTKDETAYLAKRYTRYSCVSDRNYRDYFYDRKELATFAGKKFAGQRNHINKFLTLYPEARFARLTDSDKKAVFRFIKEWKRDELSKKDGSARYEFKQDVAFLREADFGAFDVFGVFIGEKIVALTLTEKVGEAQISHLEKALHKYEGVNVYLVRETAKATNAKYVNREDDSGEYGLRVSKMQYHPVALTESYHMKVETEAAGLKRIPTLKTERLTLNAIKASDVKTYYNLCTDDDRNKYWGYDYRKDLQGELTEDYFYKVAKNDFKNRLCVNFAVRKDGEMIGETVVYEFDYKGGCKIGVRIAKEYAGYGFGEEAFEKTIRFALYTLGVKKVYSSCYKANTPSVRMHERLFRKDGEDAEKFYYIREY